MRCPECRKNISLLMAKSSGFSCDECGASLVVLGEIPFHIFATVLFIIEVMFLFSLDMKIWVSVIIISLLAIFNYYLSYRLFLRAAVKKT